MKCPKGVILYTGRKKFHEGQDVPKEYDNLFLQTVKAPALKKAKGTAVKEASEGKAKDADESAGTIRG